MRTGRVIGERRGTVLLYALIVLLVGTTLMAGWISFMGSRIQYIEVAREAIQRRIILDNSKALATQYFLNDVLPGQIPAGSTTKAVDIVESGKTWAGFTTTYSATVATRPLESYVKDFNLFSPGGGLGYTVNIDATLHDGTLSPPTCQFKLKSRNPVVAYDLFNASTSNATLTLADGGLLTNGRNSMIWRTGNDRIANGGTGTFIGAIGGTSGTRMSYDGSTDRLMMNFPFIPITSGMKDSANLGYNGELGVVGEISPPRTGAPLLLSLLYKVGWRSTGTLDSLAYAMYRSDVTAPFTPPSSPFSAAPNVNLDQDSSGSTNQNFADGAGTTTIDMLTPQTKILVWDGTSRLVLKGRTGTTVPLTGLLIVYFQSSSTSLPLTEIVLDGVENSRRVYLAVKKEVLAPEIRITTTSTTQTWSLITVFENTPVNWDLAGGKILYLNGGIRTDQATKITGGTVNLVRNPPSPDPLDDLVDRVGWLECYQ